MSLSSPYLHSHARACDCSAHTLHYYRALNLFATPGQSGEATFPTGKPLASEIESLPLVTCSSSCPWLPSLERGWGREGASYVSYTPGVGFPRLPLLRRRSPGRGHLHGTIALVLSSTIQEQGQRGRGMGTGTWGSSWAWVLELQPCWRGLLKAQTQCECCRKAFLPPLCSSHSEATREAHTIW